MENKSKEKNITQKELKLSTKGFVKHFLAEYGSINEFKYKSGFFSKHYLSQEDILCDNKLPLVPRICIHGKKCNFKECLAIACDNVYRIDSDPVKKIGECKPFFSDDSYHNENHMIEKQEKNKCNKICKHLKRFISKEIEKGFKNFVKKYKHKNVKIRIEDFVNKK